jgi:hypothetical protein
MTTLDFEAAAADLREHEFIRLAVTVVPTVDALRSHSSQQIRARVATMLDHLGYRDKVRLES